MAYNALQALTKAAACFRLALTSSRFALIFLARSLESKSRERRTVDPWTEFKLLSTCLLFSAIAFPTASEVNAAAADCVAPTLPPIKDNAFVSF